jgi:hypothetical protein
MGRFNPFPSTSPPWSDPRIITMVLGMIGGPLFLTFFPSPAYCRWIESRSLSGEP